MSINWKSKKVGAVFGSFALFFFCMMALINSRVLFNSTGRFWQNILFDALIAFIISLLSLSVWAACLPKSWKIRLIFLALIVPLVWALYWIFFGKDVTSCNCSVVGGKLYPSETSELTNGEYAALLGRYDVAVERLQPLAEQGNAKAEYYIGKMYRFGQGGLKKDDVAALRWLRKSADQGNGQAQFEISTMYENGEGVNQDFAEAYFWKSLATKAGTAIIDEDPDSEIRHLSPEQKAAVDKRVADWKPKPALTETPK